MGISVIHKGDYSKTRRFLNEILSKNYLNTMAEYGKKGVEALAAATPVDSGKTAMSWDFEIIRSVNTLSIRWVNSNINKGVNIALILQYGHGTGTGGYVQGRDYINPAIRPVFDKMVDTIWKEITAK